MLQQLGNDRYSFWKAQLKDAIYLRYINSKKQHTESLKESIPIDVISAALQLELQRILNN